MFIEVCNLTKKYADKTAVQDVSFGIKEGELLTILGPSGCGKTTILKALGGFIKLDGGKIILDGIDITCIPPEERFVSTVFQSYGLFPHMTVLENVIYGLKFKNIRRKDAQKMGLKMLESVHLIDEKDKKPYQLSGGQQQRVALARALITRPKLLLLDEPLSNLDAKLRLELRGEIKAIQRAFNITTIFVTHDQEEAFTVADKIMLMNDGQLVQFSKPRELYENPTNRFSLEFIGSVNLDEKNNRYCRLEDVYFDDKGEEMKITNYHFKGQFIEYTLLSKENNLIIHAISFNKNQELKPGDKVKVLIKWSSLDNLTD